MIYYICDPRTQGAFDRGFASSFARVSVFQIGKGQPWVHKRSLRYSLSYPDISIYTEIFNNSYDPHCVKHRVLAISVLQLN